MKRKKEFRFYWEEQHRQKAPEINIEFPGFSKDEIRVSVENNFLNISAEKKKRTVEKEKGFYREEAFQRAFRRSMSLPEGVSPGELEINVEDGAVRIRKKKKHV